MANLETVRKKLAQHIIDNGHTFREISLKMGRKDSYIQQYIRYGFPKRLSEIDRHKVCRLLGLDEEELIDDELIHHNLSSSMASPLTQNEKALKDYIMLDIYAPRPNIAYSESIIGRLALNFKEFSSWCGATARNLKIIRIEGDYMEPALPSGSLILYDSSITQYTGDGIYIIAINELTQVKRIQQLAGSKYLLLSDRAEYKDITCERKDFEILGRAITCITSRSL